jgi:hypothetical protein
LGDTPPIIRSLKLHWQPLVFHTSVVAGRWQRPAITDACKTRGYKYSFWAPDDEQCVAQNMLSNKKLWNNKFEYMVPSCWLFLNDLYTCYDARIQEHQVNTGNLHILQFQCISSVLSQIHFIVCSPVLS